MKIKMLRTKNLKGDIWFVSDFFFIITVFFTTMILLFSMSIARLIVGNLIDFTVHVTFLDFSLNTENALVAGMEIKLNPDDPQLKRILSNAAFQWDGSPNWDGEVLVYDRLKNVYQPTQIIFDKFVRGPYILELRKQFEIGGFPTTKNITIASRNGEKILVDPEVAEIEFYLPYGACDACDKTAIYRLYSTVK